MKKFLSISAAVLLLLSIALPAFATEPLRAANVSVFFASADLTVDPPDSADLTLAVEGLGTDPATAQISSVAFSSSDPSVADVGAYAVRPYTPDGSAEPTGLAYEMTAAVGEVGTARVTADVVDTDGNTYTCSCFVTARGIAVRPKNVTLEVGETRVLFAERNGLNESQASRNLTWSKSGENPNWITMGEHGSGHQREAYYIRGASVGTGTVTVALSGDGYSDTVAVTVVPAKTVSVEQDGVAVASPIDLTAVPAVSLHAVCEGFADPTVTWESSRSDLVSVTPSGASAVIERIDFSDTVVAVKATAAENGVTRTRTVYCDITDPDARSLKILSARLSDRSITLRPGQTLTLSVDGSGIDPTATLWSATTEGDRVPVKLNSVVGRSITVTGRCETAAPIAITATNDHVSDTVYVTVAPSEEKSVRITSYDMEADGFITMTPGDMAFLSVEMTGFSGDPTVRWDALTASNSENTSNSPARQISLSADAGPSTTIAAQTASLDFAKVRVSVEEGGSVYVDEIYVKVNDCNVIDRARAIAMMQNDAVTLSTVYGTSAEWYSNSQKAYFGDVSMRPTRATGARATVKSVRSRTLNPVRITATSEGNSAYTDSVYVSVIQGSWQTVDFDLSGGYGTTPDAVVMSTVDSDRSFVLPEPDAAYPSDDGEYEFYGWSEYPDANESTSGRLIYKPGEEYAPSATQNSVILYAVWTKKTENALFSIRISGDIGAEPAAQDMTRYARSCVYIEDAIDPAGFYYDVNGVDAHLAKVPSDADVFRALNMEYDSGTPLSYHPETDRIIWYVIKRIADDAGGAANWHVDGVLVRGDKVSLTYDKNIPVANVSNMPTPPRTFYDVNEPVSIISRIPSCGGETFIGWNTRPDGRGQWYTSTGELYNGQSTQQPVETQLTLDEDVVLYAVWAGRPYYDFNGDGVEDINDYTCVVSTVLGDSALTDAQAKRADMNGDGVLDVLDCRLFKLLLQGKSLPA